MEIRKLIEERNKMKLKRVLGEKILEKSNRTLGDFPVEFYKKWYD